VRRLLAILALIVIAVTATACSTSDAQSASNRTVIDVRTPAEYAAGHLKGAVNIDLRSGSFEQQVANLAKDGEYLVYCHSGNRSAQAASIMKAAGFSHVVDGGSMQNAARTTGLAIVS
jgi:rhodanese-related sulfurtransferase